MRSEFVYTKTSPWQDHPQDGCFPSHLLLIRSSVGALVLLENKMVSYLFSLIMSLHLAYHLWREVFLYRAGELQDAFIRTNKNNVICVEGCHHLGTAENNAHNNSERNLEERQRRSAESQRDLFRLTWNVWSERYDSMTLMSKPGTRSRILFCN